MHWISWSLLLLAALIILLLCWLSMQYRHRTIQREKQMHRELNTLQQKINRIEKDLSHERDIIDTIQEHMVEGILILDDADKIQLANRTATQILSIAPTAWAQNSIFTLTDDTVFLEALRKTKTPQKTSVQQLLKKEGKYFRAYISRVEMGDIFGTIALLVDVTYHVKAEKMRQEFTANVSHELKTPLTVIMTSAELAQSPDYDEECRERFLSSILTMSRQMRGLIEQMLQLARADQADPREHFSSVDLSKVASEALLPFEPIFFEAGLTLTSDLSPAVQVTGSEPQLRQVLEILLDNARKYSQEGGATQVCLKRRGKSHCLLTVANQGEPISPEALANLFKRLYRADPARSRNGSYGLGLAIAESIVNRHRGKIWAESQNGINTFYVELPCS